jgi:hypothetical protein
MSRLLAGEVWTRRWLGAALPPAGIDAAYLWSETGVNHGLERDPNTVLSGSIIWS